MSMTKEEAIKILTHYTSEYYTPEHQEAHRMAIEALQEPKECRWIPVTEREPETDRVLVLDAEENIYEATYDMCQDDTSKFGSWSGYYDPDTLGFVDGVWVPFDGVTHWMPIPELPED